MLLRGVGRTGVPPIHDLCLSPPNKVLRVAFEASTSLSWSGPIAQECFGIRKNICIGFEIAGPEKWFLKHIRAPVHTSPAAEISRNDSRPEETKVVGLG